MPIPVVRPERRAARARPAKPVRPVRPPSARGWLARLTSFVFTCVTAAVLTAGAAFVAFALLERRGSLPAIAPERPIALPAITPLSLKADKIAEAAWSSGSCGDFSKERDLPAYQVGRSSGSAQSLEGKTAALVIKLHASGLSWTSAADLNVDRAALMTQRFYLTQAKARRVALGFDVIPWALDTSYQLPSLTLDANQRLASATMDAIRDGSRLAIEIALGARLDRVIDELRNDGYANVALFVFMPIKTSARSFAVPSYRSAPVDYPEAAYLFVPTTDFAHFAVTMAHEGMHLFGADDLYRVKKVDKRDSDDVMGEYCTGFAKAKVGDATAFAVGWIPTAPARAYPFDLK
jgi:hypothetical protein